MLRASYMTILSAVFLLMGLSTRVEAADVRKAYEMKDGSVFVGTVIDEGEIAYLVRTPEGENVRVPYDQIDRVTVLGCKSTEPKNSVKSIDSPSSESLAFDSITKTTASSVEAKLKQICGHGLAINFTFGLLPDFVSVGWDSPLFDSADTDAWSMYFFEDTDDRITMVALQSGNEIGVRFRNNTFDIAPNLACDTKHTAQISVVDQLVTVRIDDVEIASGIPTDSYTDDECIHVHKFDVNDGVLLSNFSITTLE